LVAVFVLVKAAAYFLDRRSMLLELNSGTDTYGAGYTDVHAVLPAKEILFYISLIVAIAILIFSNIGTRNLVWAGASLALLGLSAVTIGGVYPLIVQQFTVNPNKPSREAPYIARTIDSTRDAYGLANVQTTDFSTQNETAPTSLTTDTTVVPTIRLLDPAVVNETYTQYQQIRSFYNFPEKLDVDRYTINGSLQDFVVGVRELDYSKLQDQQTNWQNSHTVFTHGYGFVAAPANTTCDNGAPFFVSGLLSSATNTSTEAKRCVAATDSIQVQQPRIYYGELDGDDNYVIVGKGATGQDVEFDQPQGDSQANYSYTGTGGVSVSSFLRRVLYGIKYWEPNFLLYDGFNENSKIMYVRNPRERVEAVAPFLTLDGDPYPAVVDGRVVWILDGYTTSSSYPYSQQVDLRAATSDAQSGDGTAVQAQQNINYIRNSVKATVDAYDGTVTLYSFDDSDPILKAWNQAFGGNLIKPSSAIPPDLAAHFRYPEDLFKVQRDLLSKFHVDDPLQFNNGQDFWQVPDDPASTTGGSSGSQPPYYLLTQFPGATTSRFQLTAALTPRDRQNLAALLTGVVTPKGLQLELLELPRDGRIAGPVQAQQQMVNDPQVSNQLTFLTRQGQGQLVYGNLLSLPYDGGLLYVEPVYLKSAGANAYPLMSLVLVSYGSDVGYGATLSEAIQKLVASASQSPTTPTPPTNPSNPTTPTTPPSAGTGTVTPDMQAALNRIDAALTRLQQAQQGNFADYGAALQELQAAIDAYKKAEANGGISTAATATPAPSP
jgi:uncharacterized membrane protein (UPF0182 family)